VVQLGEELARALGPVGAEIIIKLRAAASMADAPPAPAAAAKRRFRGRR
jgi:hypothetical protein